MHRLDIEFFLLYEVLPESLYLIIIGLIERRSMMSTRADIATEKFLSGYN
jgi:hypothetical protein